MRSFILKILAFLAPVFLPPLIIFFIMDPFMLFGKNAGYMNLHENYNINWNRDFQSTALYIKNNPVHQYDSFIFGNSRSFFYQCSTWEKYIHGKAFHFNASSESLYGIERKIRYIDRTGGNIKNALLVLDVSALWNIQNSEGHLFMKHPEISGESYLKFYYENFRGFYPKPFFAFMDLYLTGKRNTYMSEYGIDENMWKLNGSNNQLKNFLCDDMISTNIDNYYKTKSDLFYKRSNTLIYSDPVISYGQLELLGNIFNILKVHNSEYKVIISPLYNQKKIAIEDLEHLREIFGEKHVFDFSGINKFTSDYKNYYEDSHYRPIVANEILKFLYFSTNPM